jgi:hypothetical protein
MNLNFFNNKALLFTIVFLSVLPIVQINDVFNLEHQFSSFKLFEYAYLNHFQFGVDLIDNVGPYGWLHYPMPYISSFSFYPKFLFYFISCCFFSHFAIRVLDMIEGKLGKGLFLLTVVVFSTNFFFPYFSYEYFPRLIILFSSIYFINSKSNISKLELIFFALYVSILTLEKSANLYLIPIILFLLSFSFFVKRKFGFIFLLNATFLFLIFILLIIANQHIENIKFFIYSRRDFIDAYSNALAFPMEKSSFYHMFYYFGLFISMILLHLTKFKADLHKMLTFFVFTLIFFLSYKAGTQRGAGSYGIFFNIVPFLLVLLAFPPWQKLNLFKDSKKIPFFYSLAYLFLLLDLNHVHKFFGDQINKINPDVKNVTIFEEISHKFMFAYNYNLFRRNKELSENYDKYISSQRLPDALRKLIADSTIDEFGSEPGIIIVNNLNYKPRPVAIDFIVANEKLNKINGDYYFDNKRSPEFILTKNLNFRTYDSSAYISLLINYSMVGTYKDWRLLRKKSNFIVPEFTLHRYFEYRFGEVIPLNQYSKQSLFVTFDTKLTVFGELVKIFYHLDKLNIVFHLSDGQEVRCPVSLGELKAGFLVNPLVHQNTLSFLHSVSVSLPNSSIYGWIFKKSGKVEIKSATLPIELLYRNIDSERPD